MSTAAVVEAVGTKSTGVGKGKRGSHYFVDLRVGAADGTVLAVDRGIVDRWPHEGMEVRVPHVPGRPELGGRVDDGSDPSSYLSSWYAPPGDGTLMPFVFLLLGAGWAATVLTNDRRITEYGPRRLPTEDAAAGRGNAEYAERLTAVHDARTTPGRRAGSTEVVDTVRLDAAVPGLGPLELHVDRAEVPALATEFGEGTGWLLRARRWTMADYRHTVPAVFVAPDGRAFTCSVPASGIRCPTGDVEEATTAGRGVRPWKGVCRTSPGVRLTVVGAYAVAGRPRRDRDGRPPHRIPPARADGGGRRAHRRAHGVRPAPHPAVPRLGPPDEPGRTRAHVTPLPAVLPAAPGERGGTAVA
ncbi:hypothetical protein [Streptomyces sp. NPDC001744]|uniref:hypothetical protein n=1 Tax=Streptomyces sp. NPDC001744 TaxID=3364606 RepID=UPI0036CA3ED9